MNEIGKFATEFKLAIPHCSGIRQWGYNITIVGNANFPITFPNNALTITAGNISNQDVAIDNAYAYIINNSTFYYACSVQGGGNSSLPGSWFAIGF